MSTLLPQAEAIEDVERYIALDAVDTVLRHVTGIMAGVVETIAPDFEDVVIADDELDRLLRKLSPMDWDELERPELAEIARRAELLAARLLLLIVDSEHRLLDEAGKALERAGRPAADA